MVASQIDPDKLRREAITRLQAVIHFSTHPMQQAQPRILTGAQYDPTFENIAGSRGRWRRRGSSGLFEVTGAAEVIRLNTEAVGRGRLLSVVPGYR